MWHLIAPIVRWPLYSRTRLVLVIAVVLVGVFVAGELNGNDEAPSVAATADPSQSATALPPIPEGEAEETTTTAPTPTASDAPETTTEEGDTDALSVDPAEGNPSMAAADAAAAFVASWARPDLDEKAWAAEVQPRATATFWADGLSQTDPANTPEITVAGEPRQVAINAEEGVFDVPTSGPWIRVHMTLDADTQTWLASRVEQAA